MQNPIIRTPPTSEDEAEKLSVDTRFLKVLHQELQKGCPLTQEGTNALFLHVLYAYNDPNYLC